jgi:hypothetical protein
MIKYRVCISLPLTRQEMRGSMAGWKSGPMADLETQGEAREWCMAQIGGKSLGQCHFYTVNEPCDRILESCHATRIGQISQTSKGLVERWKNQA